MSVATTFFHGTVEGNFFDNEDMVTLGERPDYVWSEKLAKVTNKYAKNLISLMLVKDPNRRITLERVLLVCMVQNLFIQV